MNESGNSQKSDTNKPWLFQKGRSGNPSGRPIRAYDFREMIQEFLAEIDPKTRKARLTLLVERLFKNDPKTLLAYGYGKPIQMTSPDAKSEIAGVPPDVVEAIREALIRGT